MIRDLIQRLAGDALASQLEREGKLSLADAENAFRRSTGHSYTGDTAEMTRMVGILLTLLRDALDDLTAQSREDVEIRPAADELIALLTDNPKAQPVDWLVTLGAFRASAEKEPSDPVLQWFDHDGFNALVVANLDRAYSARYAKP